MNYKIKINKQTNIKIINEMPIIEYKHDKQKVI